MNDELILPDPPSGSAIQAEVHDDHMTLKAEPTGLFQGSFGTAIMGPFIILVPLVIQWRSGTPWSALSPWLLVWLGILGFVGVALTLIGIDLGTARSRLIVDRDGLTLVRVSTLRTVRRPIPRAELASIALGEAPFTASNHTLYRLEIQPIASSPHAAIRTFTARPEPHLKWALKCLNLALDHFESHGAARSA